jgi:hypothetical protein
MLLRWRRLRLRPGQLCQRERIVVAHGRAGQSPGEPFFAAIAAAGATAAMPQRHVAEWRLRRQAFEGAVGQLFWDSSSKVVRF